MGKKWKEKEEKKKKKPQEERKIKVRKVVEEWKIWDEEKEAVRSEEEARKLVPEYFHKWIQIFEKRLVNRYLQESYRIMLLRQKKDLYWEKGRYTCCQEKRERRCMSLS